MSRMTEAEEHELYLQMKDLPDFDCFPLPQHWYKKYNIEQPGLINPREFIESGYTLKKQFEKKDSPTISRGALKDENGNIRLLPFLEAPKIEIETITRPYRKEGEFDPAVLPGLIDFVKEPLGTEVDRHQPSVPSRTDTSTAPQESCTDYRA